MMNLNEIYKEINEKEEELIAIRRDFHKYAESGWNEFRTTSKIVEYLRATGLSVKCGRAVVSAEHAWARPDVLTLESASRRAFADGADPNIISEMKGFTGAVATLETGKAGPVIALRFDIDSNDVNEAATEKHRPFREGFSSKNRGMAHTCGHDGHTAIGLITAAILATHKDELCGTVKFIFQPAEEGDRGAMAIVKTGVLDDVDVVLAAHIYDSPSGKMGLAGTQTGLYATTKFDVLIRGKSAHAGLSPENGANAINAACIAVSGMQAFLQDSRGSSRLNIGKISGGSGRNVVPEDCRMCLETRGENTEVEQRLFHKVKEMAENVSGAFGCTCDTKIMGICGAGGGDLDVARDIIEAVENIPELEYTQLELKQTGGTDDFTCMMDAVREHGGKAAYMALLTPLAESHHNGYFDFDESILKIGVKAFTTIVDKFMR